VVDGDADASPQVATAEADASRAPVPQLVVARGPVQTRRLPEAPASSLPRVIAEEEPQAAAAAPRSVPDEIGTLRAQASGIATEITISLRFEP
jgi:hypothetical protein